MSKLSIIYFMSMLLFFCSCGSHKHSHAGSNTSQIVDFTADYELIDKDYGTKTNVTLSESQRIMTTNSLPNHETGKFPNKGNPNTIKAQSDKYTFPIEPKYTGIPRQVKEPGIALNGVKFDPGTAERIDCDSGETYRVEAIQDFADLGLDFNNAHVQPTGAYHYHGVSSGLVEKFDKGDDLVHIGYAKDGYKMMFSKSGAYEPGYVLSTEPRKGLKCVYETPKNSTSIDVDSTEPDGSYTTDWIYDNEKGNLDECNGIIVDGEYVYLITEEYPFIGRCLMGEFKEERRGPRNGPRGRRGNGSGRQGPPPRGIN